uniref:Lipoyl-binding domain-containing protein n=1 Tax=Kalanchoe fedtschenkoi TaxID=63787 RepID=A0A7N0R9W5_KALFE
MDSAAMLRSFHHRVGIGSHNQALVESTAICNATWSPSRTLCVPGSRIVGKLACSFKKQRASLISCAKASEAVVADEAEDTKRVGAPVIKALQNATFPKGFEALISEVCDETEVAEVKLRIGDFEMHLKRNVGATKAPEAIISPTVAPPIPSEPMIESLPVVPPPAPSKSPAENNGFFKSASLVKSPKLQALDASGSAGYVLVSSPSVGSFRRARTFKGKKQPPSCKEGDMIKEGQTIGYLDQFGTELPIKSDVAGEVLKLLVADGEPVGYGDPLIAVLPSFHGIR